MKTKPNLKRVASEIAEELLTMNPGEANAETGYRLAIMAGDYPDERNLGGRCRGAVQEVIIKHLEAMIADRNQ